ncbi:glycosyltransferase [Desulfatitalea tepidiphila]|uniref:glycosyltransferase n=1 Tax=Desulfatitalea tepidiphila TaxID=1185843 RepID=UPI0006B60629|nr:glycosyltransferase [Desulfatitalea tepidiphila]
MNNINGLWITWEFQRRNYGISSSLGWQLYEFDFKVPFFYRYFKSSFKTISAIFNASPDIVAAQNPSIVLAILIILVSKIFHFKVIIDAHNSGIYPLEGKNTTVMAIARWIQRNSDLTIVTNNQLKRAVEKNGGKGFVLPDKIPVVKGVNKYNLPGKVSIAYICTFSDDEPYMDVIKASKLLPPDITIHITGRYNNIIDAISVPDNVTLLGFIPEQDYWALLNSADLVMDLTLRENCLVCGAYEAMALSKPLILSNTKALREYFSSGCIYVDASAESIASGVKQASANIENLQYGISTLKSNLEKDWIGRIEALKAQVLNIIGL